MSITKEEIYNRLLKEKYDEVIVTDLGTFPHCVAPGPGGIASNQRYREWRDSTDARFDPLLIPPRQARGFINATKKINNETTRLSECSNFAYHAAGVLLDDPRIRSEYNIAIVGIMGGRHNIVVMVPKDHQIPKPTPSDYRLPTGSLIVDPWAVGMGYDARIALAVNPDEFAYRNAVYQRFTVNYQSKTDESLNELGSESTLIPYSERPASPRPAASPQPIYQRAVNVQSERRITIFPASYKYMIDEAKKEASDNSLNDNDAKMIQMRKILNDYTKNNSWIRRILTGHWNRHHVKDVNDIVKRIDDKSLKTPTDVFKELSKIDVKPNVNPHGSFRRRYEFLKQNIKNEPPRAESPMNPRN